MSLWICPQHGAYGGDIFCPVCHKNGEWASFDHSIERSATMNEISPPDRDIPVKTPRSTLREMLSEAKRLIPMGSLWRHYGGERYWVIGHTIDKNQQDVRVVYVPEEDKGKPDQIPFDCPKFEWEEPLDNGTYSGPRFTPVIEDQAAAAPSS
jgi:hypothetical protein